MKNVIITGGNSGLGFETAKKVARDPDYRVILACRNAEKAAAAREEIIRETGNQNIVIMSLDTSSLASVCALADRVNASGEKVDVLVNNAGISPMGQSSVTADGFELVFATNYLGHFLLTQLLLPSMAEHGAIWNITSDMHNPPGGLEWNGAEALAHPAEDDRRKYSYSKLCMIYMTHALSERLSSAGSTVTVNAFNPGFMADTNFSKGNGKAREETIKTTMPERYSTLEKSSDALAALVTTEVQTSGEYYDRSVNTAKSSELSYNRENQEELWQKSLEYCGLQ